MKKKKNNKKKTQKLTKKKHTHEMASVNFDVETRTTPERPTGSNPNLNCPVAFVILLSFCLICSLKLFPELHQIKKETEKH